MVQFRIINFAGCGIVHVYRDSRFIGKIVSLATTFLEASRQREVEEGVDLRIFLKAKLFFN